MISAPHALPGATAVAPSRLSTPDADLVRIRRKTPELLAALVRQMRGVDGPMPLLRFGQARKVAALTPEEAGAPDRWFFIGDLHGDFFALHAMLRHIERSRPDGCVCFLGDMVDRGELSLECAFLLFEWAIDHPGRVAWIAGNHDIAFSFDPDSGRFSSAVSPAELLEPLNTADLMQGFRQRLGQQFIKLAAGLPRALLFPDGLLATHGGMPHTDLQARAAGLTGEAFLNWLNSPECLNDFTWTRIHRNPKKLPNRFSPGPQYGYMDFEAFCRLCEPWFPVRRMITGHEHPAGGHAIHATYKLNPAMTLTGFAFDDHQRGAGSIRGYARYLHIAQGVDGALPALIPIEVDRGELAMMYPDIVEPTPAAPEQMAHGQTAPDSSDAHTPLPPASPGPA